MRRGTEIFLGVWLVVVFTEEICAQQNTPPAKAPLEHTQPLFLTETIPLEGIKGRFDHIGFGGGRVFVAALGSAWNAKTVARFLGVVCPSCVREPSRG